MGYKTDFDKNHAMEDMLLALLKRCSSSLDVMESMLERIYNTNCVKCEAAGHLKEYIKDVIIGVMIPATKEAINLFADETKYYVYGMYNLDKCLHVKVEEDYFPDLTYRLNGVLGETMDTLAACRTVLDSIYDILPLEPKSTEAMEDAFEGLYNMENNVQNSFTDYLEEFTLRAGRINDAMSGAYTLVSERAMGDIRMDEYEGTYRNDASLEDFRRELADVRADIGHTDDAKAAMETIRAEVQQLYDMEEFAEDQLMYIGGIAVGAVSMIVAPWATAPLLSFASGALATLYSVDQTDQGNQMYDAVQNWDVGVEIHPIVEIKNPALNMMYHITGSMALDYSLAMDLQAGNRFMKWWENMDGPGMPDNVNIAEDVWKLDAGQQVNEANIKGGSKTIITPEMEEKILLGQRKNPAKNELIGGHSPDINNSNPNYAVEVLQTNPDGTQKVKFVTQYADGNLSNIKTSTLFPDSWSNEKIINSIKMVGDSSPIGVRTSDGAMLYRDIIDGVQIEVIKVGDTVTSGYPTGGVKTGLLPGFRSLE